MTYSTKPRPDFHCSHCSVSQCQLLTAGFASHQLASLVDVHVVDVDELDLTFVISVPEETP